MSRDVTCSSKYCARVDVERRVTSPVKSQIAMDPQYDYGGQGGYSDQQQGYGDSSEGEDSLPRYHVVKQTVPKFSRTDHTSKRCVYSYNWNFDLIRTL